MTHPRADGLSQRSDQEPAPPRLSFEFVSARLAEAGMTLLALHVTGTRPAGYRSFWPDVLGAVADDRRVSPPPAARISRMDEALGWISLIPENKALLRKLVGARALVSPRSEKPLYSWVQLGRVMGCSDKSAKTWWIEGISIIVGRLNAPGLCEQPGLRGTRGLSGAALRQAADRLGQMGRRREIA